MKHPAELIVERAGEMGVQVPPAVAEQLADVVLAMLDEPQNLSSVRDVDDAVWVHVVDSLSGLLVPQVDHAPGLVDLGSGGGFPGLALAAMLPDVPVTLVESEGRKADWLRRASAPFPNVRVVADRSETLALAEREEHPLVTARAVGALPVVMELAAPLLRDDGWLVAWRGRRDADEARAAEAAAGELGLQGTPDIDVTPIPGVSRHFSVWRKVADTPSKYPRRPGIAAKRPIA
ncbi:MAG: class I SAM-dependent methyltransferase [Thermoleophilia bacterium]|nr:class I SAM-dependent methyltransferase [Thermoleophilia bacterium]